MTLTWRPWMGRDICYRSHLRRDILSSSYRRGFTIVLDWWRHDTSYLNAVESTNKSDVGDNLIVGELSTSLMDKVHIVDGDVDWLPSVIQCFGYHARGKVGSSASWTHGFEAPMETTTWSGETKMLLTFRSTKTFSQWLKISSTPIHGSSMSYDGSPGLGACVC